MRTLGLGLGLGPSAPWSPAEIPNALLVLDAAVGFTPSSWAAVVGNAATQASGPAQPSLVANALNGQPGVLFAAGQQMNLSNSLAAPGTILAIAKTTGSATYRCLVNTDGLFLYAVGPEAKLGMFMNADANSASTASVFSIVSAQVSAPNSIAYRVNRTPSSSTAGVSYYSSIGTQTVGGATAGQDLLGTICYLAVFSRVLSAAEISVWESYAKSRWGL